MKMDVDLFRGILLRAEEKCMGNIPVKFSQADFPEYAHEQIIEHVHLLHEAGYVEKTNRATRFDCYIMRVTFKGHEFISNIRDENLWGQTKQAARKAGSMSLDVIKSIAVNVAVAAATSVLPSGA